MLSMLGTAMTFALLTLVPGSRPVVPTERSGKTEVVSHVPETVRDYYALLPDSYFEGDLKERLTVMLHRPGAVVDIRNGFLHAVGDGAQTDVDVCLFKRSDRTYLVAVNYNDDDGVFATFLDFYMFENGRLRDVTGSILPIPFDETLKYELPRKGTTIVVKNGAGTTVYRFIWGGDRFTLAKR